MERPLSERRALLESGRCFTPLAHYLELSEARRVELGAPDAPLQEGTEAEPEPEPEPEPDPEPEPSPEPSPELSPEPSPGPSS